MIERQGNLWDWHATHKVVVTTNIGWGPFGNNMGAGSVLQAARLWPDLPKWYGAQCEAKRDDLGVVEYQERRLVFLPVKPLLDARNPERSWDQLADLEFIRRGLKQLADVEGPIAMTLPGAGNGGLDPALVLAAVREVVGHREDIVLVDRQLSAAA